MAPQVPLKLAQKQELEEVKVERKSPEEIKRELTELQQVQRPPYRISGGDVFDFSVYDNPELLHTGLTVTPDGYISIALIGPVKIGGMTIQDATKLIENKLGKYIRNPKISLAPKRIQSATFTILGKVKTPNRYVISNDARITDAIAMAGGLAMGVFGGDSVEIANLKDAYIVRSGKILPVNFSKALYEGDALNNIPLLNGDYIYIPSNLNTSVYVLGEVNNPASIGYKKDLTLLKALAYARGMTIEHSEMVMVIRGSLVNPKVYKVNIDNILEGNGFDFALEPNDIVYVPKGGLSAYNDVIRKIVPTIAALNLLAGPFSSANVAISGTSN
ncbi:MAG: polysaccharide biosynthesis/export family protein [Victivallaceae bacterium]|nr:polysaccharide biosynthesis/export family protein [Victivallaceae bacterium]